MRIGSSNGTASIPFKNDKTGGVTAIPTRQDPEDFSEPVLLGTQGRPGAGTNTVVMVMAYVCRKRWSCSPATGGGKCDAVSLVSKRRSSSSITACVVVDT